MRKTICIILVIALMIAALGFYLWEVITKGESDNLLSLLAVEFSLLATLVRVFKGGRRSRRPLSFYEAHYSKELGRAFEGQPKNRKKLLGALRLYNENRYDLAISDLKSLYRECRNTYDKQAVLLFTALCYDDSERKIDAIEKYEALLIENPDHATALGNLAILYMGDGKYTEAEKLYLRAMDIAPEEALAYHNLASLYYRMKDYERAKAFAHTALEKKQNMYQASALLSILYALTNDAKKSQYYFEHAVSNGQNARNLRATIDRKLEEQEDFKRYERDLAGRSLQFDGDIVITDPTYFIKEQGDWEKCRYGEALDAIGISTYLTFSHGDCVGSMLINTDTNEMLGEFASDSCQVSVVLLAELLAYDIDALKQTHPSCYTIIRDFHGTVKAEVVVDDEDQYWKIVGEGNIRFESAED
jgi:Flp pilus assembly protein TadD